ncbi:hypothetical protein APR04_003490 [Promicromonospora umidemergens]|uniref:Secreted protein n=1 Tax=Promicromonospora umidemergens TaxID=629679 RepID=A0ABP8Y328_9MICO|nr:hypothetical protein [Promicromonospora umidemergens]MCP2284567.1 hypothetical protein [Promicromonospora umidemergens]
MSRTTRIAARTVSAAAVVVLGLSLGACSGGAEPAAAPSESAPASASASPSPTELSPEDKAVKLAEPVVHEYFRLEDKALQNPSKFKYQWFGEVSVGSAQNYLEQEHSAAGEQGLHQVGATEVASVEVNEVDLTYKPKLTPPEIPFVEFTVCYDVTDLDTVDKSGKSIIPESRKDRGVVEVGVANYEYPDGPWLVDIVEYQEDETC